MEKLQQQALGIALVRFIVGLVFLVHGSQKLFVFGFHGVQMFFTQGHIPLPAASAVVVTLVEFLGGVALILGLGTRIAAALIAINMLGAIVFVHLKGGFFAPAGFEYPLTLLIASAGLAIAGSGAFALDNLLRRGNRRDDAPRLARSAA